MSNKKHSAASNVKHSSDDNQVNNTEGAHMPDARSPGPKVSEKDARAAFSSVPENTSSKKNK